MCDLFPGLCFIDVEGHKMFYEHIWSSRMFLLLYRRLLSFLVDFDVTKTLRNHMFFCCSLTFILFDATILCLIDLCLSLYIYVCIYICIYNIYTLIYIYIYIYIYVYKPNLPTSFVVSCCHRTVEHRISVYQLTKTSKQIYIYTPRVDFRRLYLLILTG